jgi:phosphoribosylanthranilate isomerase
LAVLSSYPVHAIQVEDPGLLNYLRSELSLPLMLRISVDLYEADEINSILSRYEGDVSHFLLESDDKPNFPKRGSRYWSN